jgi:hypothetical protein
MAPLKNILVTETDRIVLACSAEDWLLEWIQICFSLNVLIDSSTEVPRNTLSRRHVWENICPSFGPRRRLIRDRIWIHPAWSTFLCLCFPQLFFTYIVILHKIKLLCFVFWLHLFLETRICGVHSVNLSSFTWSHRTTSLSRRSEFAVRTSQSGLGCDNCFCH